MGAERAPAGRRGAGRVRERAGGSSRSHAARERDARASPRKRDKGNAHGDGRSGHRERARCARGPTAPHAGAMMTARSKSGPPGDPGIARVMRALARAIDDHELPAVEKIAEESQEDPFEVLISTMLSAQTRDPVTAAASARLFKAARTPRTMARLTVAQIQKLIYPVSFYRHKAKHVRETCRMIVEQHRGRDPGTIEALLAL